MLNERESEAQLARQAGALPSLRHVATNGDSRLRSDLGVPAAQRTLVRRAGTTVGASRSVTREYAVMRCAADGHARSMSLYLGRR